MDVANVLVQPIVKAFIDVVKDRVSTLVRASMGAQPWGPERISAHLSWVNGWSSSIQVLGMAEPRAVDTSTIALDIRLGQRILRSGAEAGVVIAELEFLNGHDHYLLLGPPGAGKTTTLKRLCRLLLFTGPVSPNDYVQYPLVLRLRDLEAGGDLFTALADCLGIAYRMPALGSQQPAKPHVGDRLLSDYLPMFLDSSGAVVFLDGLDEISTSARESLEKQIQDLAYSLQSSKIVVSVRTGDLTRSYEGFRLVELQPLSSDQQRLIENSWFGDSQAFQEALKSTPYTDLGARPLFLAQLMILFDADRELPPQPAEVYERIIRLALEEWDRQKGVRRASKYASFGADRKMRFLGALAYQLTCVFSTAVFDLRMLEAAYRQIHARFGLPRNEADMVAREMESHTGLLVFAGRGRIEFSHLSLQEYLCAYHMVREPFPRHVRQYLANRGAPVAIATSISANPGDFLSGLVLDNRNYPAFTRESLKVFISRLLVERPFFEKSALFGLALLRLVSDSTAEEDGLADLVLELALDDTGLSSMRTAILYYYAAPKYEYHGMMRFLRRSSLVNEWDLETPSSVMLSKYVVVKLLERDDAVMYWSDDGQALHPVILDGTGQIRFDSRP